MASIKKSFFWSAVEQVGPQVVGFVISIVLARLLVPADFGLIGMMALFVGLAGVFSDCGLSASLIQRQEITDDDETSVFALNIVLGLVLAALLCLISPLVAGFYQRPILKPLLSVQAVSVVISSFCIVQGALLARTMQFKKTALIGTLSVIASGVSGVTMAYLGFGVWSLVYSGVIGTVVRAGLLWYFSDWRPHGRIRLQSIRSVWNFSSYLLYCSLIGVAYQNLYSVIIGKVYSAESLGYYNRANGVRMLPAATMSGVVNRVAFPLFSRCQHDKALMLKRMRELVRISLLFSCAGMGLLAVMADPLIPLLMTNKWMPSVPLLRILCYGCITYPVHAIFLMALQAQGHSNLNFRLESIKMILGLIVIASTYHFGVVALAWGAVLLSIMAYFINAWYNVKLLKYRWRLQAYDIFPVLGLCAVSALAAWFIGGRVSGHSIYILMGQTATFFCVLGVGVVLLRNIFFADVWRHAIGAANWVRQQKGR
jgi:teichuronic acid exporter